MASTLSRALPRLVSSIHTSPTLNGPRLHKVCVRGITNHHGLQGIAQPWRVPVEETPEVEENDQLSLHLEALQRWHEDAQLMREVRILPPGFEEQLNVEAENRDQVMNLVETLIDEEVFDLRRGWVLGSNHLRRFGRNTRLDGSLEVQRFEE